MNITVRPLESIAEFRACEELQRRAWKMSADLNVVPLHVLLAAHRSGSVVLGAFDGVDLVGFVFGFPGFTAQGKLKLCSHMLGVSPAYQGRGVGYLLKLAQREAALRKGLDLITWTYDPLEARNAMLNIHKLGAVCNTYLRDIYGSIAIGLYVGMPTDRFEVDWWIASDRVRSLCARDRQGSGGMETPGPGPGRVARIDERCFANETGLTCSGLVTPGSLTLDARCPVVQVEIPCNYQAIKAADQGLALEWRLATRLIFESYLTRGYVVSDFCRLPADRERAVYLMHKGEDEDVTGAD